FSDLHRTKGRIPLALFALARLGTDILYTNLRERQKVEQMSHDARLGFPSAARRRRNALLATQAIVEALGPPPLAAPSRPAHGPACLNCLLDMIRGFDHQVKHRITRAYDAQALELAPRIAANYKRLILWSLFVAQLHIEDPKLVPLRSSFATFA